MAQHSLIVYGGTPPLITSDAANTAGAVVERDSGGNTFQNQVNGTNPIFSGAQYQGSKSFTTTHTLDNTQAVSLEDATAAAYTITLPAAAASPNLTLTIIKIDSGGNLVTVKGNGSELIVGANTYTGLSAQFKSVTLWCDGTKWWIIGSH